MKVTEVNVIGGERLTNGLDIQVTFDDGTDVAYWLTRSDLFSKDHDEAFAEWLRRKTDEDHDH